MNLSEDAELLSRDSEHELEQPGRGHSRLHASWLMRLSIVLLLGAVVGTGAWFRRAIWLSPAGLHAAGSGEKIVNIASRLGASQIPGYDLAPVPYNDSAALPTTKMGIGYSVFPSALDTTGAEAGTDGIFTGSTPSPMPNAGSTPSPTPNAWSTPSPTPRAAEQPAELGTSDVGVESESVPTLATTETGTGTGTQTATVTVAVPEMRETVTEIPETVTTETITTTRKGSFLVIGDWGFDPFTHGTFQDNVCQKLIAHQMLDTMRFLGDVKFIINVGDSFYPRGVQSKSDPQWNDKWRSIYPAELRSVPWYSVYGNHDYQGDPCACSDGPAECGQVNFDLDNRDFFYMPGLNWFKEHPELDLEVVALDLNFYMWGWNTSAGSDIEPDDCKYTTCEEKCRGNLRYRSAEAFDLFFKRMEESKAKNLVVFSHYPTDYLWNETDFLGALSDATKHHVEYFAGHRHSVDQQSTWQTKPNSNWLVGGGGGWGCEGGYYMYPPRNGFVVGQIKGDGTLATYSVLANHTICCPTITEPKWPPKFKY